MSRCGVNIECFSCSGGMAEGFRRAGIGFDYVFDKDPNAVASYTTNLGHAPIQMDVRDLLRMVRGGWSPGTVNLFVADPPCTPWSRAGARKGIEDERDMLTDTAELIALLRPRFYLIGNVPGLQDATNWTVVQRVIGGLSKHGYCVADYAHLDAADYGVPQHRLRPFWFGHLSGPCIRWPAPTHEDPVRAAGALPVLGLRPWVTCREALQHLPLEELGRPVRLKRRDPKHPPCSPDAPSTTVRSGGNGNAAPHVVLENGRHPLASPASPAPTIGAKDRGQGTVLIVGERALDPRRPVTAMSEVHRAITTQSGDNALLELEKPTTRRKRPAAKIPQSQRIGHPDTPSATVDARPERIGQGADKVMMWPWDRPSTTLQADERLPPPGHHSSDWKDANGECARSSANAIVLSERAAAILQGFPDGWLFAGDTKKARWSQIGQAMPPPLAHAVGLAVAEAMARAAEEAA